MRPFEYAYAVGDLFLLLLAFLAALFCPKNLNATKLAYMVIAVGAGTALTAFAYADVWHPVISFPIFTMRGVVIGWEDVGFGVISVLGVYLTCQRHFLASRISSHLMVAIRALVTLFIGVITMLVASLGVRLDSVTSAIASMLIIGLASLFLWSQQDRLKNNWKKLAGKCLETGLICSAAMFFFYKCFFFPLYPGVVEAWWNLSGPFQYRLFGVPIYSDLVYCMAIGWLVPPLFAYIFEEEMKED